MSNPWFRLYHEWDSDPKVQSMPEVMQRRLIMLFCSKCRGETLQETERAFHWRISDAELAATKVLFLDKGFMDENWDLHNWNRRQFLSDSSTDRVRKHREKKHHETHETKCNAETVLHEGGKSPVSMPRGTGRNVTVTAPDTDTDTDTEAEQKVKPLASTAVAVPADKGKLIGTLPLNDGTDWQVYAADADELKPLYPAVDVRQELRSMKGWLIGNPTLRKTRRGIRRFITAWLQKAQDEARPQGGNTHVKPTIDDSIAAKQAVLDARRARRVADEQDRAGGSAETGLARTESGGQQPAAGLVL